MLIVEQQGGSVSKTDMISRQAKIQEDTYYRLMRLLEENPDLTQRELAAQLGLSTGALNYCLKFLIAKGWVIKQTHSVSKNKFGHIYLLTPEGSAKKSKLSKIYLRRKLEEYESLKKEIRALQVKLGAEIGSDKDKT